MKENVGNETYGCWYSIDYIEVESREKLNQSLPLTNTKTLDDIVCE
jgi:hypothetical protein